MDQSSVTAYLSNMRRGKIFNELVPEDREGAIFEAVEVLLDSYQEEDLTDRAVALQVLYMIEEEDEDFGKLKRHNIAKAATKGVSVELASSDSISPEVVFHLSTGPSQETGGRVGWLT